MHQVQCHDIPTGAGVSQCAWAVTASTSMRCGTVELAAIVLCRWNAHDCMMCVVAMLGEHVMLCSKMRSGSTYLPAAFIGAVICPGILAFTLWLQTQMLLR